MERVAHGLVSKGYTIELTSKKSFWLWRAMDHFTSIFFKPYDVAFIDIFSDRSFLLAEWSVFWLGIRGKKFMITLRGGKLAEFHETNRIRVSRLFRKAVRIQTPSLFLKQYFEKHDFVIAYLPNPVDLQKFSYADRSVVTDHKLLWVRAFTEIYNPHTAVYVLQKVLQDFPDASLTMVGPDKGLLAETQALIERLNLNHRVTITGPIPNDKLSTYYQSHDVYLNTTSYESFGVAVVEAASCGVPVVSFRVGEIPYLWTDEKDILLCDHGNVDQMANQVKRIFGNAPLSLQLSLQARERVEDFSWEKIKHQWVELVKG